MRSNRILAWLAAIALWLPVSAQAASAGFAVVIANDYDGFLQNATRDAAAIADKVEEGGFSTVRLLGLAGAEVPGRLDEIRKAAEGAGTLRIVYATGFGMCANDDLVLFAEDMQPEQVNSGQLGDAAVPLSALAEAAATGGGKVLVVFDTIPNQCTEETLKAVKLPEGSALLLATSIGGDVRDEVEEGGHGAFATVFLKEFSADRMPKELVDKLIEQIQILTEEQQVPVLIGEL